jgi:hypothetical protein
MSFVRWKGELEAIPRFNGIELMGKKKMVWGMGKRRLRKFKF